MSMQSAAPRKGVSIGGGTGQPNAIRALRTLGLDVAAIVGMVDDGGSTGILRREAGVLPPGDVRKCMSAMASDTHGVWAQAFEHRFDFADNHALGNLMLTALADELGSFEQAIAYCSELLKCTGEVIPSTYDDVVLCGRTRDGHEFTGQAALGTGPCALSSVWLNPREPSCNPRARQAILDADVVVLGPGSLFTSVLPNICVPGIAEALHHTKAAVIFVCSLADMQGETWGLSAYEHVEALLSHGLSGCVDAVFIHRPEIAEKGIASKSFEVTTQQGRRDAAQARAQSLVPNDENNPDPDWFFRPVEVDDSDIAHIEALVDRVIVRDFSSVGYPTWHDVKKLASAVQGVLDTCHLLQK